MLMYSKNGITFAACFFFKASMQMILKIKLLTKYKLKKLS